MTSTRARHRASASPLHWATRSVVAVVAVPVGALTGCLVAAASTHEPALGLAGMTVAAVPLALHAWHARRAEREIRPLDSGRHAADSVAMDRLLTSLATLDEAAAPSQVTVRVPAPRRAAEAVASVLGAARAMTPARGTHGVRASITLPGDLMTSSIDLRPELLDAPAARAQRDSEIAKLRRLWDAGTGADTMLPPAVPALQELSSEQAPAMPAGQAA